MIKVVHPKSILASVLLMVGSVAVSQAADFLSPYAVVAGKDGRLLYIAEATANQVALLDVGAKKVVDGIRVKEQPTGMTLSGDGKTLYVTAGVGKGSVYVVDTATKKVLNRFAAGHSPTSPQVSSDGKTLYVCARFENAVLVMDVASGKILSRIPVLREPISAVLSADGKALFVANHLPAGASDGAYAASAVSVVDTAARNVCATIKLPNGSMAVKGICLSPDGKYAYLSHQVGRYHLPTTQLERGWMNTNAMTIIDALGRKYVNTVLLDDVDHGAANPWGVACSPDGKYVCVTLAGTHELTIIDRTALHDKLERLEKGERVSDVSKTPDDVVNDLAFLYELRRRIKTGGNGSRGVAVIGETAYVTEYFSDTVSVVDLKPDKYPRPGKIALGPAPKISQVRQGEIHFHDAALCFQHWQSCVSCHPDVRSDGLNWDLLNDGMGNPKNTKSMVCAHRTPPAMVTGVRPSAEVAVRAGIRYIQFAVRPEEDAEAIDAYLKSLAPVPSPLLVEGKLCDSAKRGVKVYEKAGCAVCHPAPRYTDLKLYNVGIGTGREKDVKFDTPSLVECWRTGPYLYDGRAATIEDVLVPHNKNDKHGKTTNLSKQDLADLAAYVKSL